MILTFFNTGNSISEKKVLHLKYFHLLCVIMTQTVNESILFI